MDQQNHALKEQKITLIRPAAAAFAKKLYV
jgi:hypothetical protein